MMSNWQAFENYLQRLMQEEHIAGAAVGVSQAGKVIYQQGFGYRNLLALKPVTPDTIFGIASVSKSFTAMVITQLADEGKLSIDDPVIKYLPEFELWGVKEMAAIKIHHLLSHTTGLPPVKRRQDIKRFDVHLEYLAQGRHRILGEPGAYFSYSNDAFLLLGAIIERVTGQLYRRVMTKRILEPLGMVRSTYSVEEVHKFDNVTIPYVYQRESRQFASCPWPELGVYEVGGGVRSNVVDLLKYGEVYVNGGMVNGRRFVSENGLKRMWRPVYQVDRNSYYGYALKITPNYNGVTLVEHGGGQPGVSSNFGFVPERQLVVAVLTNVSGVPAAEIWLAAVNTALGLPLELKRSVEPECPASLAALQQFCGLYKSEEGGQVRIFADNGQVYAETYEGIYPVRSSDPGTLVMLNKKYRNTIRFYRDREGKPWAAFYGLRMLHKCSS